MDWNVGWLYRQEVQYLFPTCLYHTVQQEFLSGWFLPPATNLREGNVSTPLCHSVHRGLSVQGEWVSVRETPLYGNVRVVHILLECILVTRGFTRARKSLVYKAQCRGCCRCYICVIHFITIQLVFRSLRPKLLHLFTNMIRWVFSEPDCWMQRYT